MVWEASTSCGHESAKIASIAVSYLRGKCLDLGCGLEKCWPLMIGVDSLKDYGGQRPPSVDIVAESDNLSMFASNSMDGVFSSHLLEHIPDYKACLKEWWRVLKPDGNLVLYLPHKELYPNVGQPGSNPDHKHDFMPDDIINVMKKIGSWELLENEKRDKGNEYSFYQVYKKLPRGKKPVHKFKVWERNPKGLKRCMVIRYGAIGDQIQNSSILPELKKQGYHITYNTSPSGYEILKHNPHIDDWFIQDKDFVPNQQLGPFWQTLAFEKRWDKIINLCESIEGGLLTLPGRLQFDYPDESRRKLFGTVNYLERHHDIAGVPYNFDARFYATKEEQKWAKKLIEKIDAPIVAWAINGSAHHKVYPWVQVVTSWLATHTPAHIFLMGDETTSKELQDGIMELLRKDGIDTSRIHPMCGKWTVRESLAFVEQVDCLVGPETGLLNAVGLNENVAKVIYLSHSSAENLTKHWKNTFTLEPDKARAPCWPCHRLHYGWDACHRNEDTKSALCASAIAPKLVFDCIVQSLGLKKIPKVIDKSKPPEPPHTSPSGTSGMRKAA